MPWGGDLRLHVLGDDGSISFLKKGLNIMYSYGSITFSPDGQHVALTPDEYHVLVKPPSLSHVESKWSPTENSLNNYSFSKEGDRLAVLNGCRKLEVFNLVIGERDFHMDFAIRPYTQDSPEVRHVEMMSGGVAAILGQTGRKSECFIDFVDTNVPSGGTRSLQLPWPTLVDDCPALIHTLHIRCASPESFSVSSCGSRLALCDRDSGELFIFDQKCRRAELVLRVPRLTAPSSCCLSLDRDLMLIADADAGA